MDLEVLKEYIRWSDKKDLMSFANAFEAGWKARDASRSVDPSMVLVDLQDFAKIAQRHPDVIGRPIYYAQWPTPPEGQE